MAWVTEVNLVPTSIGQIVHFLDDLDGTVPGRSLQYNLLVNSQIGIPMKVLSGNEQPFLTGGQISNLLAFMDVRRAALPVDLGFAIGNVCGRCTWQFSDPDGTPANYTLFARVVEQTAGGVFVRLHKFDDEPFLSGAQISAAVAFLGAQRTKAIAEILP